MYRDLRGTVRASELDAVMQAFAMAGAALEEERFERALELLEWAKSAAPRSPSIREALGVARYLAGDLAGAQRELLTYRRLSGRCDQNHLLADCARAAGRHDKVAEYIDEMKAAHLDEARMAEGLLVLAGDRADRGDLRGALGALESAGLYPALVEPWHLRLWYLAGDLHERMGEPGRAREFFEAITAVADHFLDVTDRLAALPSDPSPQ